MKNSVHLGFNVISPGDLKEPQELHEVQKKPMQTPASATEKSQAPTQAGNQHLESSFAERTWGLQPTS